MHEELILKIELTEKNWEENTQIYIFLVFFLSFYPDFFIFAWKKKGTSLFTESPFTTAWNSLNNIVLKLLCFKSWLCH